MRKHVFTTGEYYHIYNRGVDKRDVILDTYDLNRFLESLKEFNTIDPIGALYLLSFNKGLSSSTTKSERLVSITAYCINPNHFHLILTPLVEKGVEKFMQRIGGYTRYFNEKYERSGTLFQGKFKSKHISDDRYLLHLSAYINMNNRDLQGNSISNLSRSSLEEYIKNETGFCDKSIVLEQFKNNKEYSNFAMESWLDSESRKAALEVT